jgi:hypothetical protein
VSKCGQTILIKLWRFVGGNQIQPLDLLELVKHACVIRINVEQILFPTMSTI